MDTLDSFYKFVRTTIRGKVYKSRRRAFLDAVVRLIDDGMFDASCNVKVILLGDDVAGFNGDDERMLEQIAQVNEVYEDFQNPVHDKITDKLRKRARGCWYGDVPQMFYYAYAALLLAEFGLMEKSLANSIADDTGAYVRFTPTQDQWDLPILAVNRN